jgi:hypothetical protein
VRSSLNQIDELARVDFVFTDDGNAVNKFEDIAFFIKKQSIADDIDYFGGSFYYDGSIGLQLIKTGAELRNSKIKSNLANCFLNDNIIISYDDALLIVFQA